MKTSNVRSGQVVQVLAGNDHQCVWMKAGVVNFKTCENAFDCTSCAFDKGMSWISAPEVTSPVRWQEVMRQPHLHKECRHMLTGRVLFKLCSHNYNCKDCAYDQQLYEYEYQLSSEGLPAPAAPRVDRAPGLLVPALDSACSL
jgi:hypothetical protein